MEPLVGVFWLGIMEHGLVVTIRHALGTLWTRTEYIGVFPVRLVVVVVTPLDNLASAVIGAHRILGA